MLQSREQSSRHGDAFDPGDGPNGFVQWIESPALDLTDLDTLAINAGPPNEPSALSVLSNVTVMMVDDEPMMTAVVQTYLEEAGYSRFIAINDPRQALDAARLHRPGLLLLDLMMPGLSGFEILAQLRSDEVLRYTPVIVLTAAGEAATKLKALELGASEFLAKPVHASELVLRVRNSLVFKVYQDRLADEDLLTGLPNRRVFVERLQLSLARARNTKTSLALLHLDLDRFRQVNDMLGNAVGDRLLAAVAERLKSCTRRGDELARNRGTDAPTLSRLGGDEFSVLLPEISTAETAGRVARRMRAAMSRPFQVDGKELFITPSIGISVYPDDGTDDETLMRNAGAALEHAKGSGRNTFAFYSKELNKVSLERLGLEGDLRRAIERDELLLHYQPKVDLASGRVIGAEALLRWNHPQFGLMAPDRFISIAEESGLIVEIGEWVMQRACAQIAEWRDAGLGSLKIAINVSRHEMVAGALVRVTREAMTRHGIERGQLVIELTESLLMDRIEFISKQLQDLRSLGVEISIDDFGTGYSSMSYLKRFAVDELKIDRSFLAGTPQDKTDVAIVRAIIVLAHSLTLRVVAEGVETQAQRAMLQELSCDAFQGYLCSRPLPAQGFSAKIAEINGALR
jgi:diguanylate cyclase (GGDEF)-like protein